MATVIRSYPVTNQIKNVYCLTVLYMRDVR